MHTLSIQKKGAEPSSQGQFEAEVMFDQGLPYPIMVKGCLVRPRRRIRVSDPVRIWCAP